MRKMTPQERSFFDSLLLLQLIVVLVSGFGLMYPVAATGVCTYIILDVGLGFTKAKELLATTPRRFAVIAVTLVIPVAIGMTIIHTKVLPEIRSRNPNIRVDHIP